MSSDESDIEDDPPKYYVHPPQWRSPELSSWLHVLDQLEKHFRASSGRAVRGALPRLRIHSADGPMSDRRFVRDLPRSAYNEDWLSTLVNPNYDVGVTNEEYHFAHDNGLFSSVFFSSFRLTSNVHCRYFNTRN